MRVSSLSLLICSFALARASNVSTVYSQGWSDWSGAVIIPSYGTEEVHKIQSGIIPEIRLGYSIYNSGSCTNLKAKLFYWTFGWNEITSLEIEPFTKKYIDFGSTSRVWTKLDITNLGGESNVAYFHYGYDDFQKRHSELEVQPPNTNTTASSQATNTDVGLHRHPDASSGTIDFTVYGIELIKVAVSTVLGEVPGVGNILSQLVGVFWPKTEPDVWYQVRDRIANMIDQKILEQINRNLDQEYAEAKRRIEIAARETETKKHYNADSYMSAIEYIKTIEFRFKYGTSQPDHGRINLAVLPMFSQICLLKVSYYLMGLRLKEPHELEPEQKKHIKEYIKDTMEIATVHINQLFVERLADARASHNAHDAFNKIQAVRSQVGVYGFEYLNIMNHLIGKFISGEEPGQIPNYVTFYNDVVSYSPWFGRFIPEMGIYAHCTRQPLTPKHLSTKKRNRLSYVDVYLVKIGRADRIGGIKLTFENGDTHSHGALSNRGGRVVLGETKRIEKIKATGFHAVDTLEFYLSDNTTQLFGEFSTSAPPAVHTTFSKTNHHIVGIVLSNSVPSLASQAGSIAVAYFPNYNVTLPTFDRATMSELSKDDCGCKAQTPR